MVEEIAEMRLFLIMLLVAFGQIAQRASSFSYLPKRYPLLFDNRFSTVFSVSHLVGLWPLQLKNTFHDSTQNQLPVTIGRTSLDVQRTT